MHDQEESLQDAKSLQVTSIIAIMIALSRIADRLHFTNPTIASLYKVALFFAVISAGIILKYYKNIDHQQ